MNPRAIKVSYKAPHTLIVTVTKGEEKIFRLQPYLAYPVYEKLKDESFCSRAKVHDGIVVWDNETDMDPDRLYLESRPIEV